MKVSTKPVLLFDCAISLLPVCLVPLIACAGDDGCIHLYNFQTVEGELGCVRTMKVSGHDDWVRALTFTIEGIWFSKYSSYFDQLFLHSPYF